MSRVFHSWKSANHAGYQARGLWRDMGFVVKKGEQARAVVQNEEVQDCKVYHREQVRELKEPQRSKRILIGRFLGHSEIFAIRDHHTGKITQHSTDTLYCSPKDLVYKTLLYKNRTKGIRVPIFGFGNKRAEGFDFRCATTTHYLVIDLDNHRPTWASTEAHLLLVKRLVELLPRLIAFIGGGRVFFDYRQDAPQGLHIWIWFQYPRNTARLHEGVRTFLISNSDPALDERLRMNGLLEMGSVEILPTERHCIRFFGGYDRRVFTTEELKPTKHGFDAESLLKHLNGVKVIGDPCQRYGELARAGLGIERQDEEPPIVIPARIAAVASDKPSSKDNFFAYLVDASLNGVSDPDELYASYLIPLATALYFREFHDHPQQGQQVVHALMNWLERKHNGMVSRLLNNQRRDLERSIAGIVRKMDGTPEKVREFWASVRQKDVAHPDHRISLVRCMETVLDEPFPVTRENLAEVRRLVEGGDALPSTSAGAVEVFLPTTVEARLRDHLARCDVALGACTDRIVRFAEKLIQEIGVQGQRTISSGRINQLALLGKGRKAAGRYKTLLVGAGILRDRGKGYSVRERSAQYRLTDWVVDEIRKQASVPLPAEPKLEESEPVLVARPVHP
jgi:hypothetical protein